MAIKGLPRPAGPSGRPIPRHLRLEFEGFGGELAFLALLRQMPLKNDQIRTNIRSAVAERKFNDSASDVKLIRRRARELRDLISHLKAFPREEIANARATLFHLEEVVHSYQIEREFYLTISHQNLF